MEKVRLSFEIDADLAKAVDKLRDFRIEQLTAVINHALADYLSREAKIADGLAAMDEYEAEYGGFSPEERSSARRFVESLFPIEEQVQRSA